MNMCCNLRRRLWMASGFPLVIVALALFRVGAVAAQPGLPAAGTTYNVNSTVDEPNATLGSPVCSSITSTVCTLRAAVMAANANPGADTIMLPSGTFHLTITGTDDLARVGDLDITDDVTIVGAGDGLTIVDGSQLSPGDRLFDLRPSVRVTMTGLTLRNGRASDYGGAIRIGDPAQVNGGASLDISNCSILNNQAGPPGRGGGFFNAHAGSTLVITNCTLAGNTTSFGGAIDNRGTLTISNSRIYSNSVDTAGGGIENEAGTVLISDSVFTADSSFNGGAIENVVGSMTLSRVTLSANWGGQGAGVLNNATLLVQDSTIAGNHSDSTGGGLLNQPGGTLTLLNIVVASNTATLYGGGIANSGLLTLTGGLVSLNIDSLDGGGGLAQFGGTARVDRSALVSNTASIGGGVLVLGGAITLTNSTVSGNSTSDVGAGIYNHGASSTVSLANVTVAYNGTGYLKAGGGLDNDAGGTLNLRNSLIAWNSYQGINFPVFINDCSGPLSSGGYNLVRVDCGFSHQAGDQVGTFSSPLEPRIGPLLYNGGATPTHALLAGSPAVDAGNPSGCLDFGGAGLASDQRGFPRPANGAGTYRCDIGAYELQRALFLPLIVR